MERVLIAVGGNALYDKASGNNLNLPMVQDVARHIVRVAKAGYLPVVTFGNGPQVGNLLDMAETSARMFADPVPLDVCVSWTQGEIGYRLLQALQSELKAAQIDWPVVAVNTTVIVDADDPAFLKPTKPVGRFISPEEAQRLYQERGWVVGPDANRGYRRLVPSPRPQAVVEVDAIADLVSRGVVVLCGGGGGVPVRLGPDGRLIGVEAVIDKDYTSCLLAKTLGLENLLIATEVPNVYLKFGTPEQQALTQVALSDAERYLAEGEFPPGSMGPKVSALLDYLRHGGRRALMTDLPHLADALLGEAGTAFLAETSIMTR